jgi:SAM-dependent methyltransferase
MDERRERWDSRYAGGTQPPPGPLPLLRQFAHLLPRAGRALDLACGRGGNALYLARRGLDVSAWDYSQAAVTGLAAQAHGLSLVAENRDVVADPPPEAAFDVICVGHFLERSLCPAISAALRPGGLLFYQTFVRERVAPIGPSNPAFLLAPNELLALFAALRVRYYREEGTAGDRRRGVRNVAQLVAQACERPPDR